MHRMAFSSPHFVCIDMCHLFDLALRFALGLVVLVAALPVVTSAGTGITLVQHTSKDAGTTNLATLAFPSNNMAGNWIGVCIRAGAVNEIFTVSDSKGNTYHKAIQFSETLDGNSFGIYYAENVAGGANTVTVSHTTAATLRFAILEYSGVATSGSLDVFAATQGNSAAPNSGVTASTTANGDLLLGAIMTANPASFTPGNGHTIQESVPSEPGTKLIAESQIQTTAGGATASATLGATAIWAAGIAAFKPATGVGGTSPSITSSNNTTFTVGAAGTFTATTTGTPTPSLTETGTLPSGVTFKDNGNGTATLSGTPATGTGGTYSLTFTASNGVGTAASQNLTLTVGSAASAASVGFVQVNYATPQAPQTKVAVAYTQAQMAGNLNVVVVGWNDSTAQISSVTDSKSNAYVLAVGPTVQSGTATQAIYYAKNIAAAAANSNVVAVTFNTGATSPDIRIAEYSGIDTTTPVDVVAAAQGNGTASNSGSVNTGNANDLLVGASLVQQTTTGPGSGYTSRIITSPDGDILEDQIVNTAGSYSATAADTGGAWIMQMVAFRAAGSAAGMPPSITSANKTTFTVGAAGAFTVTTTGTPTPSLSEAGTLPSGVTFKDNGNGTATLSGTPASGTGGTYSVTFTANNGGTPANQSFTLSVNQPPAIASGNSATFTAGAAGTFTVNATGTPTPSLTETGALPSGVTFKDNGNAAATLSGTPATGGTYSLTFTASNGVGTAASQNFTLTVGSAAPAVSVGFVQANYATPQPPQPKVTVAYTQAQTAGNLNVVVVGWNDSTAQINSVTDSKSNPYVLAVGPTVQSGMATQAIYYAKNIAAAAANSNAVTVTFNTGATSPDIRIAEYSGIDTTTPVDVVATAQGNGTASNSGSVNTGNANDLLVGANLVQQMTTGPGSRYTSRMITSPDGDILEDQIVNTAGSYSATAADTGGAWIMQMVAFRAAGSGVGASLSVTLSPKRAAVTMSQSQQFAATVNNDPQNGGVSWSVDGIKDGNTTTGTISSAGLFTPGAQPGVHTITATSNSNSSATASATIAVTDLAGMFTYHNDTARTGQNLQEYALTTTTVTSSTFGMLFSCQVDGYVYAEPLYIANFNIGGQRRNVVFVATEHDSVYVFDADSSSCVQLWHASFLSSGVTTVPPADTGETGDLVPEIGITSTPVIDASTNTIYVVAKTKETAGSGCSTGNPCYFHRLHALDLSTGAEKFGGPVVLSASSFVPLFHLQRPALLLNNGTVYIGFGSHGDNNIWQGWLMAYNATTLAQRWVWHSTDPASGNNGGAIWGGGNGPASDASGNIYVETANGVFDGVSNLSDSVVKLSPAGTLVDFFTPFDQGVMQQNDIDLGSSGPIILPDAVGSPANPHVMIATGKVGVVYLLDQTNLGGYNSASNQDLGEVNVGFNTTNLEGGFYGQPVYWNGNVYTVVVGDSLRQYSIANGSISTVSSSSSGNSFRFRGATPAVSSNGTADGIVWVADITAYQSGGAVILDAYDATNVSTLLYSSPASGSGAGAAATKFTVPMVANGKVYVGGQFAFTVFGLLPN